MSYLISQILVCLLIAAGLGAVIGYLWKHFAAKKAADLLDTSWGDKYRNATKEMETLRADVRAQAEKAASAESVAKTAKAGLATAHLEVIAQKEKSSKLATDLAGKGTAIAALEGALAALKAEQVVAARNAGGLNDALKAKDEAIAKIKAELDAAANDVTAKDASVVALKAPDCGI